MNLCDRRAFQRLVVVEKLSAANPASASLKLESLSKLSIGLDAASHAMNSAHVDPISKQTSSQSMPFDWVGNEVDGQFR